jgi:hypothetical protein
MYVADVKMGVVLFDHIPLVPLPEHRLLSLSVLIAPTAVRLAHFPIGAHDSMPAACHLSAPKLVPELHRDFFERRSGCHGVFRQIVASVQSVARSAPPLLKAAASACSLALERGPRRRIAEVNFARQPALVILSLATLRRCWRAAAVLPPCGFAGG